MAHWKAVERILGNLKRNAELKLYYIGFPVVLKGYSDVSWITKISDNILTSRWLQRNKLTLHTQPW